MVNEKFTQSETTFQLIILKKNRKLSINDKFGTNTTKKFSFCHSLIFFMKLRLNFWVKIFWMRVKTDTAQKRMKKPHIGNMPQTYSQFKVFCFFQWLTYLKKAYTMICNFLMGNQVLQSVMCRYNYLPH